MIKLKDLWELWCAFAEDVVLVIAPLVLGLYILICKSDVVATINDEFLVVLLGIYSIWFGLSQAMRLPKTVIKVWRVIND